MLQSHCYKLYVYLRNFFILLLLKCLPSIATKKLLVKIVEHKLEEATSDGIRDFQLGRFLLLKVPISQQVPKLTSLYLFNFPYDR